VNQIGPALPFALALCIGMLAAFAVGSRLGLRRLAKNPNEDMTNFGVVEGAVLGLYGLLIAFTFSSAANRFDSRRGQIVEEANNIGTAYLRIDLLPKEDQPAMRERFRRYLEARLATTRSVPNSQAFRDGLAQGARIQSEIWQAAVAGTRSPDAHVDGGKLLLPALNAMIDITTTRMMATRIHPPDIIFGLLFLLAVACSTIAGYTLAGRAARSWLHIGAFIAASVIAGYVILEVEYPRVGLIRLDAADNVMEDLRETMR
jgi:hypothetical protein